MFHSVLESASRRTQTYKMNDLGCQMEAGPRTQPKFSPDCSVFLPTDQPACQNLYQFNKGLSWDHPWSWGWRCSSYPQQRYLTESGSWGQLESGRHDPVETPPLIRVKDNLKGQHSNQKEWSRVWPRMCVRVCTHEWLGVFVPLTMCTGVRACLNVYACLYVHLCRSVIAHVYMCSCLGVHMHMCECGCSSVCAHVCVCMCVVATRGKGISRENGC